MTDYEPYVADPAEPAPRQALQGLRPWLIAAIVALLLAGLTLPLWQRAAEQDPSLEVPQEELEDFDPTVPTAPTDP